jgi:hypothetical protein
MMEEEMEVLEPTMGIEVKIENAEDDYEDEHFRGQQKAPGTVHQCMSHTLCVFSIAIQKA